MSDKIKDLQSGDFVRISFRAQVLNTLEDELRVIRDRLPTDDLMFGPLDMGSPFFHVEKLPEPLRVGDRVEPVALPGEGELGPLTPSTIMAIQVYKGEEFAIVDYGGKAPGARLTAGLRRVEP